MHIAYLLLNQKTDSRKINNQTLEQPGVKAPGTAKMTPFLLAKSSARFTLLVGDPSYSGVVGNLSPTCVMQTHIHQLKIINHINNVWRYEAGHFHMDVNAPWPIMQHWCYSDVNVENQDNVEQLRRYLNAIYQWSVNWQVLFSMDKRKIQHVGNKNENHEYLMELLKLDSVCEEQDIGVL